MHHRANHHITFVDEESLPAAQDFAFVECEGEVWFAVKRSRVTEAVLEEAWLTFRNLTACDPQWFRQASSPNTASAASAASC